MSRTIYEKKPQIGPKELWCALSDEEKQEACEQFWRSEAKASKLQTNVLEKLAGVLRFRIKFLKKKADADKARLLVRYIMDPRLRQYALPVVKAWLLEQKAGLITDFLDHLSVPHKNGRIRNTVTPPEVEQFVVALNSLLEHQERRLVAIYVSCHLLEPSRSFAAHLPEALQSVSFDVYSALSGAKQVSTLEPCEENLAEEEELPELGETFTTLDVVMIRALVACALDSEYALSQDKMEHLMEEVVELNADRQRSYFHRGFFHAVFEREMAFDFPGSNDERRIWYLCGALFGCLRKTDEEACIRIVNDQRDMLRRLINSLHLPCGKMLLPSIYQVLRNAGEYELVRDWLKKQTRRLTLKQQEDMLAKVYDDAAGMMRRGPSSEAGLLLEVIEEIIDSDIDPDSDFVEQYYPLIRRKRAQVLQMEGSFEEAASILQEVINSVQSQDGANAMADLGLIQGGFRSLQSILPKEDESALAGMCEALTRGRTSFEEAIEQYGKSAVNAHFCMGVWRVLSNSGPEESRADHLQQALAGMQKKQEAYAEGGLTDWSKFLLAIALLETLDEARLQIACDRLHQALQSPVKFPFWLWKRAIQRLKIFDNEAIVETVAKELLAKRGQEAFTVLREAGLGTAPGLQEPFLNWLIERPESAVEKWPHLEELLSALLMDGATRQAETLLDYMETCAVEESACRKKFIQYLCDQSSMQPVWDESEVATCLCQLHEINGQFDKAAHVIRPLFFRLRNSGEPHEIQEARQIIECIRAYGLDKEHWDDLDNCLTDLEDDEASSNGAMDRLRDGARVRVLYVGGNETQASFEDRIRQELRDKYAGLEVKFHFPAWNSNWNIPLDAVKRELPWADVVVLNRLVRTNLGKAIRESCGDNPPWLHCTGKGRTFLQRRIEEAAVWSIQRKGIART